MNRTGISWTDFTLNFVTGCEKVSPGCQNCYAEAWARRWGRSFAVKLHPERLREIRKIPPGAKVFADSMSDLFHPAVSRDYLRTVFAAMAERRDVVFQILTKRPENMLSFFRDTKTTIASNMWLGVSVEMALYKGRIDLLTAAFGSTTVEEGAVPFVSFEPLLGDIGKVDFGCYGREPRVKWIIIGGESGPGHRPMKLEWARALVRQAKEQGVAVWMKQLGGPRPGTRLEDLPEDLRLREFPQLMLQVSG